MGLLAPQHDFVERLLSSGPSRQDLLRWHPPLLQDLRLHGGCGWHSARLVTGSFHCEGQTEWPSHASWGRTSNFSGCCGQFWTLNSCQWLAKTPDHRQSECGLILSLFIQEYRPVLLLSAPGVDSKSHNSKLEDDREMTRFCSHVEDRESVIFWVAACDWMGSRCAGTAHGGELLPLSIHS